MKRKTTLLLKDMIENMQMAEKLIVGIGYQAFLSDEMRHYAVLRRIEIIGEAARQISEEIRLTSPIIPWKELAEMPEKVIYANMGINFAMVWQVVRARYPLLHIEIKHILKNMSE
jgi:uncharacterized protein with HEPN domain